MNKNYALVLIALLCAILSGYGQVSENFDSYTSGGYGNYNFNNFDINNGLSETTNARSGRAVRLRNQVTANLEYVGADGNGKDDGVGDISFWYRSWDTSPTAVYDVEVSINGAIYSTVGAQISTSSTTYAQWTHSLNNTNDNIRIRVIRVNGERLIIDDFEITDYAIATGPTVTYNGNSNTGGSVPTDANNPYTSGDTVTVLGNTGSLTNTCSTFNNWNTVADGSGISYSAGNTFTITANTTLYAQWTSTANTVTFNNNGGTDTMAPQMDCMPANLANNTFTNTGFTFNSWNTAANGSGTTYADGASYSFSADVTLYAQWDVFVAPCASESFVNISDNGTYNTKNWTGDNSIDWTATDSRSDQDLNGDEAIMLRDGSLTNDTSFLGGCGIITFDYARIFTGNSTLQVFVGGIQYGGNITVSNTTSSIFTATINVPGTIDIELRNSGNRTLISNLSWTCYTGTPNPEIQLVDNTASNQNCGYSIDFGSLASDGSSSNLTFDIENNGTADLNISSLNLTAGDFTIVSPTAPLTITAGNSQTVIVQFTPTSDGILSSIITIINDDLDEGSCIVNLTGEGFTPSPNIIVRGVTGSNPTIANGSTSTLGFNNTLYTQQTINATQQTKSFRIGNEGGTADLTVSNITLTGNTADFFVTSSFTNPFAADTSQDFTITFQPTTLSGFRSVTVSIANSDSSKDPYTFVVGGTANCPSVSGTLSPVEGPAGTTVTILSPGNDLTGATATLNGVALTIISDTTTELVVRLPNTITVGGPLSVQLTTSCVFSNTFTLLDDTISGCETSTSATVSDLFISEVTDSPSGSLTYVELYNATGATINFTTTNYSIVLYNNGNTTTPKTLVLSSGSVPNNSTYVISMGVSPASSQCAVAGGDGSLAQIEQSLVGASINFFRDVSGADNPNLGHDFISLNSPAAITGPNPNGIVDAWGTSGDETWATGLGLNNKGANFQRDTSSIIPNPDPNFIATAWIITDWNDTDCSDVDYSTIGAYDFSTGVAPSVTLQPIDPSFACNFSASITIAGTEGFDEPSDTKDLEYRWFVNSPGSNTWDEILPSNTNYTGQQTVTLNIIDTSNLDDNQYYCQIREDNITCYVATNAIILDVRASVWDGTDWSSPPVIDRIAIIDGNYDTSIGTNGETSFEACQLIVNTLNTLNIANNTFVRVQNNVTVDGNIVVKTDGSFVQVDDLAIVNGNVLTTRDKISVEKETAQLATYQEYTYWSSPVIGELLNNGLAEASVTRRFTYSGQNFRDSTSETNNDGATVLGQDDIDDDANDWQTAAGTNQMLPGVGYAATHNSIGFIPAAYIYTFEGAFNNGVFNIPIYRNDVELLDNNWNFIGNPYPSAIDADLFLAENASIDQDVNATDGAIFFWSHNTAADGTTNGNENLNYAQSDYAIINGTGQIAGGDGLVPTRHIPSGQGFFVSMNNASTSTLVSGTIRTTDVIFNNSMRVTGNNNQFFRTSNSAVFNKLRLNLTSDNGIFSQMLVGYVDGATDDDDGMYYDATRNLASNASSLIYSLIDATNDKKFAIQGKDTNSLALDEVIPLGFYTSIDEATLYKISIADLEGDFMNDNTVYIKDNLMNIIHDLNLNDYTFTSETGEFNNRFEIVFQPEALSLLDNVLSTNDVSIVELSNGDVNISVGKNKTITSVDILDILGRTIYRLRGQNSTETYNLSQLSKATYMARITLSNGQVITKKAVKQF